MMGGFGGMGGFGIIGMLLQLGILIAVIYFIFQLGLRFLKPNQTKENSTTSMDILKDRYASGEISEEEFHKIKENLLR